MHRRCGADSTLQAPELLDSGAGTVHWRAAWLRALAVKLGYFRCKSGARRPNLKKAVNAFRRLCSEPEVDRVRGDANGETGIMKMINELEELERRCRLQRACGHGVEGHDLDSAGLRHGPRRRLGYFRDRLHS